MAQRIPKEVRDYFAKLGKKGGKVVSERKSAAAKENGKLGGRPRNGSKRKDTK